VIAAFLGHGGENRQFAGAVEFSGERTVKHVGAPLEAGVLELADGAHGFTSAKPHPVRFGRRRIGDVEGFALEPGAGKLAVECRRIYGCLGVVLR